MSQFSTTSPQSGESLSATIARVRAARGRGTTNSVPSDLSDTIARVRASRSVTPSHGLSQGVTGYAIIPAGMPGMAQTIFPPKSPGIPPAETLAGDILAGLQTGVGQAISQAGGAMEAAGNILPGAMGRSLQRAGAQTVQMGVDDASQFPQPQTRAGQLAQSVPGLAGAIGVGALTGGSGLVALGAGAATAGAQSGGQQYLDAKRRVLEAGGTEQQARDIATREAGPMAVFSAATSIIPMGRYLNRFAPGVIQRAGGKILGTEAGRLLGDAAAEGSQEAAEELTSMVLQSIAEDDPAAFQQWGTRLKTAGIGGAVLGGGTGAALVVGSHMMGRTDGLPNAQPSPQAPVPANGQGSPVAADAVAPNAPVGALVADVPGADGVGNAAQTPPDLTPEYVLANYGRDPRVTAAMVEDALGGAGSPRSVSLPVLREPRTVGLDVLNPPSDYNMDGSLDVAGMMPRDVSADTPDALVASLRFLSQHADATGRDPARYIVPDIQEGGAHGTQEEVRQEVLNQTPAAADAAAGDSEPTTRAGWAAEARRLGVSSKGSVKVLRERVLAAQTTSRTDTPQQTQALSQAESPSRTSDTPRQPLAPEAGPSAASTQTTQGRQTSPTVPAPAKGRKAWEMTKAEAVNEYRALRRRMVGPEKFTRSMRQAAEADHAAQVESALASGKPVPASVLADYPDLATGVRGGAQSQTNTTGVDSGDLPLDSRAATSPTVPASAKGRDAWEMTRGEAEGHNIKALQDMVDGLGDWSRLTVSDGVRRDAQRVIDNPSLASKVWSKYAKDEQKGLVQGGPRRSRTASSDRRAVARALRNLVVHQRAVEQALASGKPVPASVLADYPDLATGVRGGAQSPTDASATPTPTPSSVAPTTPPTASVQSSSADAAEGRSSTVAAAQSAIQGRRQSRRGRAATAPASETGTKPITGEVRSSSAGSTPGVWKGNTSQESKAAVAVEPDLTDAEMAANTERNRVAAEQRRADAAQAMSEQQRRSIVYNNDVRWNEAKAARNRDVPIAGPKSDVYAMPKGGTKKAGARLSKPNVGEWEVFSLPGKKVVAVVDGYAKATDMADEMNKPDPFAAPTPTTRAGWAAEVRRLGVSDKGSVKVLRERVEAARSLPTTQQGTVSTATTPDTPRPSSPEVGKGNTSGEGSKPTAEQLISRSTSIVDGLRAMVESHDKPAMWMDHQFITEDGKYEVVDGKLQKVQPLSPTGFMRNLRDVEYGEEKGFSGANKAAKEMLAKDRQARESVAEKEAEQNRQNSERIAGEQAENSEYRQSIEEGLAATKFKKQDVQIAVPGGTPKVVPMSVAHGLGIHKATDGVRGYVVTHVRSGKRIGIIDSLVSAKAFVVAASKKIDFTQDDATLVKQVSNEKYAELLDMTRSPFDKPFDHTPPPDAKKPKPQGSDPRRRGAALNPIEESLDIARRVAAQRSAKRARYIAKIEQRGADAAKAEAAKLKAGKESAELEARAYADKARKASGRSRDILRIEQRGASQANRRLVQAEIDLDAARQAIDDMRRKALESVAAEKDKAKWQQVMRNRVAEIAKDYLPTDLQGKLLTRVRDAHNAADVFRAIGKVEGLLLDRAQRNTIRLYQATSSRGMLNKLTEARRKQAKDIIAAANADVEALKASDATPESRVESLDALREKVQQLQTIHHEHKFENKIRVKGQWQDLAEKVRHLGLALTFTKTPRGRDRRRPGRLDSGVWQKIQQAGRTILTPESVMMRLDGEFTTGDVATDIGYKQLADANQRFRAEHDEYIAALDRVATDLGFDGVTDILSKLGGRLGDATREKIDHKIGGAQLSLGEALDLYASSLDPETGKLFDKGQLWKFRDGAENIEISGKELSDIIGKIDDRYIQFHQHANAMLNAHYGDIAQAHWTIKGFEPPEVPNHWPRRRDTSAIVPDAKQNPAAELDFYMENAGGLKTRKQSPKVPLFLDDYATTLMRKAEFTFRTKNLMVPLYNARRLLQAPEIADAVRTRYGEGMVDNISEYLQDVAGVRRLSPWQQTLAQWTRNYSRALTQVSPSSWAIQLSGLPRVAMERGGFDVVAKGWTGMFSPGVQRDMLANSEWARVRRNSDPGALSGGIASNVQRTGAKAMVAARAGWASAKEAGKAAAGLRMKDAGLHSWDMLDKILPSLTDQIKVSQWFEGAVARVVWSGLRNIARATGKDTAWVVKQHTVLMRRVVNSGDATEQAIWAAELNRMGWTPLTAFTNDASKAMSQLYRAAHGTKADKARAIGGLVASAAFAGLVKGLYDEAKDQISGNDEEGKSAGVGVDRFVNEILSLVPFADKAGNLAGVNRIARAVAGNVAGVDMKKKGGMTQRLVDAPLIGGMENAGRSAGKVAKEVADIFMDGEEAELDKAVEGAAGVLMEFLKSRGLPVSLLTEGARTVRARMEGE